MRTNLPKKQLGLNTTPADQPTKGRQFAENQTTANDRVLTNAINYWNTDFNTFRFTFGDAICCSLLFISTLFLTTNIDQAYHPKIEARLLGIQAAEVVPAIAYTPVLNPLPSFVKEFDFYTEPLDEMPVEEIVVLEENRKRINLQSLQPTTYNDQVKVTITSDNRIILEERTPLVVSTPNSLVVDPVYTPSVSSSTNHQAKTTQLTRQADVQDKTIESSEEIYYTTVDETRNKAVRAGKSSFVLFGASWCAPCRMMKDVLRTNEPIRKHIANNFLYDHVDIESGEGRLLKLEYNVSVVPTFILFDANGNQVQKYEGAMNSQRIMQVLGISNPSSQQELVNQVTPAAPTTVAIKSEARKMQLDAIIADVKATYVMDKKSDK